MSCMQRKQFQLAKNIVRTIYSQTKEKGKQRRLYWWYIRDVVTFKRLRSIKEVKNVHKI